MLLQGGWLQCVIREPGGCGGGREQSRGGEELNQGFAERARENVGKESRREIQITYCEPWFWVRLSELGFFWYFVGLYVCLVWVGELLQIGHSINSSPSRSISVTQRPSRSRSDSDLLHTEVAGQKEAAVLGIAIRYKWWRAAAVLLDRSVFHRRRRYRRRRRGWRCVWSARHVGPTEHPAPPPPSRHP